MTEIAHLLWVGGPLSVVERVCIQSFVAQGFAVRVWSYDTLDLPPGAMRADASAIMDPAEVMRVTQGGTRQSRAAFSDRFRYAVLGREEGWWFDTDVLALQPAEAFRFEGHEVVAGFEDARSVAAGVLRFHDRSIAHALSQRANAICEAGDDHIPWGAIGPRLVTAVVRERGLLEQVSPIETFYPIHHAEYHKLLLPAYLDEVVERTRHAHTVHLWNEVLRRFGIPKDRLPPRGSYLADRFLEVDPSLRRLPYLSNAEVRWRDRWGRLRSVLFD